MCAFGRSFAVSGENFRAPHDERRRRSRQARHRYIRSGATTHQQRASETSSIEFALRMSEKRKIFPMRDDGFTALPLVN